MRIRNSVIGGVCAAIVGTACVAGAPSPAALRTLAGPPAVCVPIECNDAGVRIGNDPFDTVRGYSAEQAVQDALAALAETDDVLSHMETLRRVVVYVGRDEAIGNRFLAQLLSHTAEAEADHADADARALAWFDAGYFVGALAQMGSGSGWKAGESGGIAGLGWLDRAAGHAEDGAVDAAAIHFAAALLAHPAMRQSKRDLYESHMRQAIAHAEPGSLLRKNLETHAEHWDESLESLGRGG